jgi:ADP-ribose pyrophosphatase
MDLEEKTLNSRLVFQGKMIGLRVEAVRLPNGSTSTREVIVHPGAVAIIAVNQENKLVMVKQFRKAVEQVLLEIPAGKLEPDEDPVNCAVRELEEETGYRCNGIKHIMDFYSTPGFSNEILHLYYAWDLIKNTVNTDDDEFLEVVELSIDEIKKLMNTNSIKDSKTLVALLYYLNRQGC